jgi:hypothetical protein
MVIQMPIGGLEMYSKKTGLYLLVFCLALYSHCLSSFSQNMKGTQQKTITKQLSKYGIPKLEPGELWISSVPTGLKVYLLPAEGSVVLDSLCSNKNLKGITPVSIKVEPGYYMIGIERLYPFIKSYNPIGGDTWETLLGLKKGEYPWYPDKNDIKKEGISIQIKMMSGIMFDQGRLVGCTLVKYFTIQKKTDVSSSKLIALHFLKNTPLDSLNQIYPKGNNFSFSDGPLIEILSSKGITQQEVNIILQLLHRGGKIALTGKDKNTIVIEIIGENKWDVYEIDDK